MTNSHRFFKNNECKYFPCHDVSDRDSFNCLFCYCPLYSLGDKCGGKFTYNEKKTVKICMDCELPHIPKYYDIIISELKKPCS